LNEVFSRRIAVKRHAWFLPSKTGRFFHDSSHALSFRF
jgi:hypothetical protein